MTYDGPAVFRAPYANEAARENFERTVVEGLPASEIEPHTDRTFSDGPVRLWGTKETIEPKWSGVSPGDYLIFYRDGTYTHATEVVGTERNDPLGRTVWTNHGSDAPWVCLIYLEEPTRIDIDSAEVHDLAGYDIDYPMGFSPLNEMGIGGIRGRYGSVEAFASRRREKTEIDTTETPRVDLSVNILDGLHFPGDEGTAILEQVEAALNGGKHVVLTGPPGTGKTEIARRTCEYLATEYGETYTGYRTTTATADWSTFETVGGYMPEEGDGGRLQFEPGQVLKRFKRDDRQINEPLVVDEINRADVDKSFGQLFTLLSGQSVQLPFTRNGSEVEILRGETFDGEPDPHEFVKPASWRLFATMNSYDKTSLYELSYAFMRRFAFVHVGVPNLPENEADRASLVADYADTWDLAPEADVIRAVADVWHAANTAVENRKLGPAIARDLLVSVSRSGVGLETALTRAVSNYVLPQLEGVRRQEQIVSRIASTSAIEGTTLRALAGGVLGVEAETDG